MQKVYEDQQVFISMSKEKEYWQLMSGFFYSSLLVVLCAVMFFFVHVAKQKHSDLQTKILIFCGLEVQIWNAILAKYLKFTFEILVCCLQIFIFYFMRQAANNMKYETSQIEDATVQLYQWISKFGGLGISLFCYRASHEIINNHEEILNGLSKSS